MGGEAPDTPFWCRHKWEEEEEEKKEEEKEEEEKEEEEKKEEKCDSYYNRAREGPFC